jgi:hypothetical protein
MPFLVRNEFSTVLMVDDIRMNKIKTDIRYLRQHGIEPPDATPPLAQWRAKIDQMAEELCEAEIAEEEAAEAEWNEYLRQHDMCRIAIN